MRSFTDIFVKRPVLASVISLLIVVLGARAAFSLSVRQYPETENAVITVSTTYYGADPDVVAGFITTPLENAVAQANGIDYLTSSSKSGVSTITAYLRLNYDYNRAMTEINAKVNAVTNQLPPQSQKPVISVQVGQSISPIFMAFKSSVLQSNQLSDYLLRVVLPKVQSLDGVQSAFVWGARNLALRAWLDPNKLAAFGMTAADVNTALANNDYISGLGNTKGQMVQVSLNASTGLHTVDEFRDLVVKQSGNTIVRLRDVANVTLGSEDYDSVVVDNGQPALFVGVDITPTANLLNVAQELRDTFPSIAQALPSGVEGRIMYDASEYVTSSINEVEHTIIEALVIVTLVVFVFLGSIRSVFIPVIAIPLSLIGAFMVMPLLGFSINLLTLLAMVLAIGLVVDDAIIVVENVHRHMNDGMRPMDAAIQGARELASPIIAMTLVLVAVYIPVAFQGGLTGALFTEFAFTLVGTVVVSAIVALTLSPMMCAKLLKAHGEGAHDWQEKFSAFIDRWFARLQSWYSRKLHSSLNYLKVTAVFAVAILASIAFLYSTARQELAPTEDQSFLMGMMTTPPNATLQQTQLFASQLQGVLRKHSEVKTVFQNISPQGGFFGMALTPWNERSKSASQLMMGLFGELGQIPGIRAFVFPLPSLPGGFGQGVQFVITTTENFDRLNQVATDLMNTAKASGRFQNLDIDLKIDRPQATVEIDRDKAALLGLSMSDVGASLSAMLGGGYVNYFTLDGRSYRVMSQVEQQYRLNPEQLLNYYIRTKTGDLVPLSTIAHITTKAIPQSLPHFQQLNAATISGSPAQGQTTGDVLAYLNDLAAKTLPEGYAVDYGGTMRQQVKETSGLGMLILFAVILIFLVLAALFESFRDPLIILVSVPMSIFGALIFIGILSPFGIATLNIYTQVGLVTLIGLISKHGILIVDVANHLRTQGHSKREAVEMAASIRLRPILMTTAAMVLGVMPLIFASGAGANARFNMGLVVASGVGIGTLFTLFVVPAAYLLISSNSHKAPAALGDDAMSPPAFKDAAQ